MITFFRGDNVFDFLEQSLPVKWEKSRCHAIGIARDGIPSAAVVFDNYKTMMDGTPLELEASVVVLDKKSITRYTIAQLLIYPFIHMNVKRLLIRCGSGEYWKRSLVERLGFTFEGIAREAWPFGGDAALYSMLHHECKWLKHGKFSLAPSRS